MEIKQEQEIDLMFFCGENNFYDISTPWSEGDSTYATDGALLIRVPKRSGIAERENTPPVVSGELAKLYATEPETWHKIPHVAPLSKSCTLCNGTGKVFLCPECGGDGEVDFSNVFNDYEGLECQSCCGRGFFGESEPDWIKKYKIDALPEELCMKCSGTGFRDHITDTFIEGVAFNDHLLAKLAMLPGVEIGVLKGSGVGRFSFDGGDGLLMPLRGYGDYGY